MRFKAIITAASSVFILSMSNAFASDGSVDFTGSVVAEACSVGTSSAITVPLGNLSASGFATSNTSVKRPFSIKLTNCPASVTKAKAIFGGTPAEGNTSLLALSTGTGAATGLAVKLFNGDLSDLGLHQYSKEFTPGAGVGTPPLSTIDLNFFAAYQKIGSVTAGAANAKADFDISYN